MKNNKNIYEVGDIVVVNKPFMSDEDTFNKTGTIIKLMDESCCIEFDENVNGTSLNGMCKSGHGRCIINDCLLVIKTNKEVKVESYLKDVVSQYKRGLVPGLEAIVKGYGYLKAVEQFEIIPMEKASKIMLDFNSEILDCK